MTTTTAAPVFDITVSRVVPADPETVWTLLTDVTRFGDLSPENVESHWLGDERGVGARFKGSNKLSWAKWSTTATVTDWEPGRRFGFDTSAPSATHWSYELEAVEGGTRVTESMLKADKQVLPIRIVQRLVGVPDRVACVREGMETTLERLAGAVA
jgi:uncharacterized protein YndB with AHSA1/START domain